MNLSTKAVLAFLACPGVVAGLAPVLIARTCPGDGRFRDASFVPLAIGALGLLWCVRDFFVRGRGTLAPWDPPKRLVVSGLYRRVRNPMYLSVLAIILGWSFYFGTWRLALYLGVVAVGSHLRVTLGEEPRLRAQFGPEWDRYARSVPRWIPRLRAR
jgi:protein-S-isoprenylcysteine O-methyltransferase Ste14